MIISHTHRFIFIKSYKTAGTSVEAALSQQCGGRDVIPPLRDYRFNRDEEGRWIHRGMNGEGFEQHEDAEGIRAKVPAEVWEGYYKFSITRNPWDRVVSLFFWDKRRELRAAEGGWLRRLLRGRWDDVRWARKAFREWVRGPWENNDRFYFRDGELCVDYVLRYERLLEDYRHVCGILGVPAAERLPRLKGGIRVDRRHYSEYYDEEAVEIVAERHRLDIEVFGYRFERP